ncbi:MAG: Hpt domain-containing protein [Actinomycetota bacterium]
MSQVIDRSVLDEMAEMMGGMTEIVDDIVGTYLVETPPLVSTIAGDSTIEDVRIAAHTLKSSSRAVGAMLLGDLAEEIEGAARDGSLDGVAGARGAVQTSFDQAAELLGDWQAIPA